MGVISAAGASDALADLSLLVAVSGSASRPAAARANSDRAWAAAGFISEVAAAVGDVNGGSFASVAEYVFESFRIQFPALSET